MWQQWASLLLLAQPKLVVAEWKSCQEISHVDLRAVVHNNLGNHGPDSGKEGLFFMGMVMGNREAGPQIVQMEVTAKSVYANVGTYLNGLGNMSRKSQEKEQLQMKLKMDLAQCRQTGCDWDHMMRLQKALTAVQAMQDRTPTQVGQINLMAGTETEFEFSIFDRATADPVALRYFGLTFMDISFQEQIIAGGYSGAYASSPTEVVGTQLKDGRVAFHVGSDSPEEATTGDFVAGKPGSNECPIGTRRLSLSECQAMPGIFGGKPVTGFLPFSSDHDLKGCFVFGAGRWHFNMHATGAPSPGRTLFCKKATQTDYVSGQSGSNACPASTEPLSLSECRFMPTIFGGKAIAGHMPFTSAFEPHGCFEYGIGRWFFNSHRTGSPHVGRSPFCRKTHAPVTHLVDQRRRALTFVFENKQTVKVTLSSARQTSASSVPRSFHFGFMPSLACKGHKLTASLEATTTTTPWKSAWQQAEEGNKGALQGMLAGATQQGEQASASGEIPDSAGQQGQQLPKTSLQSPSLRQGGQQQQYPAQQMGGGANAAPPSRQGGQQQQQQQYPAQQMGGGASAAAGAVGSALPMVGASAATRAAGATWPMAGANAATGAVGAAVPMVGANAAPGAFGGNVVASGATGSVAAGIANGGYNAQQLDDRGVAAQGLQAPQDNAGESQVSKLFRKVSRWCHSFPDYYWLPVIVLFSTLAGFLWARFRSQSTDVNDPEYRVNANMSLKAARSGDEPNAPSMNPQRGKVPRTLAMRAGDTKKGRYKRALQGPARDEESEGEGSFMG